MKINRPDVKKKISLLDFCSDWKSVEVTQETKFDKMSGTMRNFIKLQGSRQLLPEMCLKRLQSTCEDKMDMTPERKKFKALQAKMQRDIHAPVYLVMGTRDRILYNFTLGLVGFGTLYAFYTLYTFTKRPP